MLKSWKPLTEKCESCWSKVEAALARVAQLDGGVVEGGEEGARQYWNNWLQTGQHGKHLHRESDAV